MEARHFRQAAASSPFLRTPALKSFFSSFFILMESPLMSPHARLSALLCPPLLVLAPALHAAGPESPELPAVEVVASPPPAGSAAAGYRQDAVELGPLGRRAWRDTPYSVTAVSAELLRNQGAETFSQAAKYLPSAYVEGHFGLEIGPPVLRGLQGDDVAQSVRIDGLNVRADVPLPIELYDRLELLGGPSAALYGPAPAAGMINSVLKRPTETPLREVGIAFSGRGNTALRADLGGRAESGIGYRLNLLEADGEGYTANSNLRRELIGVALDLRPSDDSLLELLASHYRFDQRGYPGAFVYSNASGLPTAPDPARAGYGQRFAGVDASSDLVEIHGQQRLANGWRIDGALQQQVATRDFVDTVSNTLTSPGGAYKTTYRQSASRSEVLSNYLHLNGEATTGSLRHTLAVGTTGYAIDNYSEPGLRSGAALTLGNAALDAPLAFADPGWGGTAARYRSGHTDIQSLTLSDTITFDPRWSLLLAANDSWISSRGWNASGAQTSAYAKRGVWSYAASLLCKLEPASTLYLTYADSVQPGEIAPSTISGNPGQALAPYRSSEWEVGAKATLAGLDLNAALFQIERPFAYTDTDGFFKSAGEQRNRGLEIGAGGYLDPLWVIHANATWLDPRMTQTLNPANAGGVVVGVPRRQANLLLERRLAEWPGSALEANLHYVARRAANVDNTLWAAAYTTLDLGARYESRVAGQRLTTRLTLANVTDRHYWASLYTGNSWSGGSSGAGTGTAFLGEPRTLKLSLALAF